ncbi:MAG: hypothetical protein AAF497_12080, partial [Planctomycetota bacterium]
MLRNLIVLSILLALGTTQCWSQRYKVLPVGPQFKSESDVKKKRSNKSRVLLGTGEFSAAQKKVIDEYYKKYVLPTMTNIREGSKFGMLRIEL